MYVKTHPVPFGEFIPFRRQLASVISRFDRVPRDFAAGEKPGLLDIAGVPVGDVICFEIAYGEVVDAVVSGGARVITVQTNNATYGGTAQPDQQFQIERLRAIEAGRSVVVASTTGISAVIRPDGSVQARMEQSQTGWLNESVDLRGTPTPAQRAGKPVEAAILLAAVGSLAVAAVRSVRSSRSPRLAA